MKRNIVISAFIAIMLGFCVNVNAQIKKSSLQSYTLKKFSSNNWDDVSESGNIGVAISGNDTVCWYYIQRTNNRFSDPIELIWDTKNQMLKDFKSIYEGRKELVIGDDYVLNDKNKSEFTCRTSPSGIKGCIFYNPYNPKIYATVWMARVKRIIKFLEGGDGGQEKKYKHFERR